MSGWRAEVEACVPCRCGLRLVLMNSSFEPRISVSVHLGDGAAVTPPPTPGSHAYQHCCVWDDASFGVTH